MRILALRIKWAAVGIALLAAAFLAACDGGTAPPTAPVVASTQVQPTLTSPPVEDTPTPTAIPAIALVNGEPRFGMLETIRTYAVERLAESGETVGVIVRSCTCWLPMPANCPELFRAVTPLCSVLNA